MKIAKRLITIFGVLFYLAILAAALLILIKPGASFFFNKITISTQEMIRNEDSYEFTFTTNTDFYNPDTILFLESGQIFTKVEIKNIDSGENGIFALNRINDNKFDVLFVPADASNPATNGKTYQIYIRPYFISGNLAGFVVIILLLGIFVFFSPLFFDAQKRKTFLSSPLNLAAWRAKAIAKPDKLLSIPRKTWIIHTISNVVLIVYLYIFMEWIFLITKSSFLDFQTMGEKIAVFFVTGMIGALLCLLCLPVILIIDLLFVSRFPAIRKFIYPFPAAFLAACLSLILLDNFTYNIFNYGVVNSVTVIRVLYALLFIGLLVYFTRKLVPSTKKKSAHWTRIKWISAGALFTLSLVITIISFNPINITLEARDGSNSISKPNIILLGTDGLNANSMSVYGYERDTTPFIKELAQTSLLSENHFTDNNSSSGSEVATLTGRSPFSTDTVKHPVMLQGEDMFLHLPGILKGNGYRTVSIAVPAYVDAYDSNIQNGFDVVNNKSKILSNLNNYLASYGYSYETLMLTDVTERITDRLSHIFFFSDMQNVYAAVSGGFDRDFERWSDLRSELQHAWQTGQPLFVHVHLLATHGPRFFPDVQVFSKGEDQYNSWMTDFYDDAVLDFDTKVQQLVQFLKDNGQYDNTIIIIYTDHAERWISKEKIPLIIHFPGDQYAGVVTPNTLNSDIAPTILDFMGIQKPEWMDGQSLLQPMESNRLILIGDDKFDTLAVQCQNYFLYSREGALRESGQINQYASPCPESSLDTQDVIHDKVELFLSTRGYE